MEGVLETPLGLHGSHASANDANANNNTAHPDMRTEPGHDQVGWEVEDNIAHVEQRETSRYLLRVDVQDGAQIVAGRAVHRLGETHV